MIVPSLSKNYMISAAVMNNVNNCALAVVDAHNSSQRLDSLQNTHKITCSYPVKSVQLNQKESHKQGN